MTAVISCTQCGTELLAEDRFCPECGLPVPSPPVVSQPGAPVTPAPTPEPAPPPPADGVAASGPTPCVACGRPLEPNEHFCPRCGVSRDGTPSGTPSGGARRSEIAWARAKEELVNATAGRYEILRELGRGGMAAVFLAYEARLDRKVAIKLMSPAMMLDEAMVERFVREARNLAKLDHPNIVDVHNVFDQADLHFFVMRYVPGPTLDLVLRASGPLPASIVCVLLAQISSALGYAHRRGLIHRDVKPSNILLDEQGNAIVTDFGIAKTNDSASSQTRTVMGTALYMSPEQITASPLTGASDQYSLGILAYELLTGKPPFQGSEGEVQARHLTAQPAALGELRPDCPAELTDAVMRMLAKAPEDRWPSVSEAAVAAGAFAPAEDDPLREVMAEISRRGALPENMRGMDPVVTPRPAPPRSPGPRAPVSPTIPTRRPRLFAPIAALAVIGLAAVVYFTTRGEPTPSPVPPIAAPSPRMSITFLPPQTVRAGSAIRLSAVVRDSVGVPVDVAPVWVSSDSAIARISGDSARFVKEGQVTLSATYEGAPPSPSRITVLPASTGRVMVDSIRLGRSSVRFNVGDTLTVLASALDREQALIAGARPRWEVGDRSIVEVSRTGLLTAKREGSTTLVVSVDSARTVLPIQIVAAVRVAQVVIDRFRDSLRINETRPLTAKTLAANRTRLTGRTVEWRSATPEILAVSPEGVVEARRVGAGTVIATSEGRSDSARFVVSAGPEPGVVPVTPLPLPAPTPSPTPAAPDPPPASGFLSAARVVVSGAAYSCATIQGQGVLCWGKGRPTPSRTRFSRISIGASHVCGLTSSNAAECSGRNTEGQLGNGSNSASTTSVPVKGDLSFSEIVAGDEHTCARTAEGKAYCWGRNKEGQLGDGSTTPRFEPVPVKGDVLFRRLSAGGQHTCGVGTDGVTYCWGNDFVGAVGVGLDRPEPSPQAVGKGLGFKEVHAGKDHTCALTGSGRVYCWGNNTYGQLGIGSDRRDKVPLRNPVEGNVAFTELSVGAKHTCGLTSDGELYCWGDNTTGQLGNGSIGERGNQRRPSPSATGERFRSVSAGTTHTCGVTTEGEVLCWGDNNLGQLGDGTVIQRSSPTKVKAPGT